MELETEKRATIRTTKTATENRESEKSQQKQITELKGQLTKQTQLLEKAKNETIKVKEDWEKQKNVLESKLEKERTKNKSLQEKNIGRFRLGEIFISGLKMKEEVIPSLLSPMKQTTKKVVPPVELRKPVARKAQPSVSEFSTTPFFARQGSVIPQPSSPSITGNTSILGRSLPIFGGSKSKPSRSTEDTTILEEHPDQEDSSIAADASILTDVGPRKKKRKLAGGIGNRTLLAVPDESPVQGNTFGISSLMLDSPAVAPKFAGKHLVGSVKPKRGLLWNMKKGAVKLGGDDLGISPEKGGNQKMRDIKKGFTLNL